MNLTATSSKSSYQRLLSPKSIAIVGASNDISRIGGKPLARLISGGFEGPIYPINPNRETVQGVPALKSVMDLPMGVDCAIIAVPATQVLQAAKDCADRDVGAAIVFTSGFAEAGERGVEMQAALTALAKSTGMRILGPNCMGSFNVRQKAFMTFGSWTPSTVSDSFNLGVVSQSGGYGTHVLRLCQRRNLSVSQWLTTGNECDVEAGELIGAVAATDGINAILVYLEGIRSKEALLDALELAHSRRIPVIILKSGRTDIGASAAASHTASLAGADAVYDAVFDAYGVYRADTTEEAIDVAYALSKGVLPADPRTAVFTLSGGVGVQIADYMCDVGLSLPELSRESQDAIKQLAPQAATRNPLDITAQFLNDPHLVKSSLDLVLGKENFSVVLSFLSAVGLLPDIVAPIIDTFSEKALQYPGRLSIVCLVATPDVVKSFEAAGSLVFEEPKRAVVALAALSRFAKAFDAPLPLRTSAKASSPIINPGAVFNELQAKELLRDCGIASPREVLVTDAAAARKAAVELGLPVAMKVVSADILHKTDVGGVALNLKSADDVAVAFEKITRSVARCAPDARVDGIMVSPMVSGGVECVLGINRDSVFGQVVMFGLGGVMVDVFRDVSFRLAPVSFGQAMQMIREIKGFQLLDGFRGSAKADVDALARAIVSLSEFASNNADVLQTVELNPVRVLKEGIVALDAVIETLPAPEPTKTHSLEGHAN